jgi:hypothetical protein
MVLTQGLPNQGSGLAEAIAATWVDGPGLAARLLELYPGGHFSASTDQFERAAGAAADWYAEHLRPGS